MRRGELNPALQRARSAACRDDVHCMIGFNSALTFAAEYNSQQIEEEAAREAIAESRGYRDEQGVRDQWLSTTHIGQKYVTSVRKKQKRILE